MEAIQQTQQTPQTSQTENKKKVRLPVYWAIELDNGVFQNPQLKEYLDAHPDLIPLKKIHSTLLYVGKKHGEMADKIAEISQHEGKKCTLEVDGFGYSERACALSIMKMTLDDNTVMPSYPNKHQHVTVALKTGTAAVESVETLVRENRTFNEFSGGLLLHGTIKAMYY